VWGVPCSQISAEWGAQRIKGLSIWKTLLHAVRKAIGSSAKTGLSQKEVQTSLIDQFLYPKFGPGQMWEEVAGQTQKLGGEICTGFRVDRILTEGKLVRAVQATHAGTGSTE
jgi:protoporphyrinogen oxidase